MAPRNAAVLGGLASVLGLVGIGCAVFGPATYSYGTNWLRAGPSSLWDQGLTTTSVLLYLAVMIVAALGIGAGVSLRSQRDGPGALIVLWTGTVVLLGGGLLTLPGNTTAIVPGALHTHTLDSVGMGVYLLGPALVALAAAVLVTVVHRAPQRGESRKTLFIGDQR